jgi:hypothetical protein
MTDSAHWLVHSATLQFTFSIALGWLMLVPRQPWGRSLKWLHSKDFTAAHVDWFILSFMQFAAVGIMSLMQSKVSTPWTICVLLALGGWLNPVPYVFRAIGINAFTLGGDRRQMAAAALAGLSSLAITVGWGLLLFQSW